MKRQTSIYLNLQAKLLLIAFSSVVLVSCVGTVKDSNPISTRVLDSADKVLKGYDGISAASAISDKKVEVLFSQLEGNPDNFSYSISYDGQSIPILIDANNIRTEPDNDKLKYTINNLDPNTTYNFAVQIKDKITGSVSSNSAKRQATTFNNITADFFGVSELRNVSGAEGKTSIQVFWPEAVRTGPPVGIKAPGDPVNYKITVVNANTLTTVDINDETKGSPSRQIFTANGDLRSIIVKGLIPNTKYYVQVRSVHSQAKDAPYNSDLNYKIETNTKYLAINTFSDDPPEVNLNSLALTHSPGFGGYFAIDAEWEFPQGNYDHVRLYYSIKADVDLITLRNYINGGSHDENCDSTETGDTDILCQKTLSSFNSSTLTNLIPNTPYNVMMAVCLDITCRQTVLLEGKELTTTPLALGFEGIKTVEMANTLSRLDQLYLKYNPIDLTKGHIDGLEVYYTNDPADDTPELIEDTATLFIENYNFQEEEQIVIGGLTLDGTTTHCFDVYPYTINSSNVRVENKVGYPRQCITNAIVSAPSSLEFPGLLTGSDDFNCDNVNKTIDVEWNLPTKGVYSHFEVFYQRVNSASDSFSFDQGIAGNVNYQKVMVGPNVKERTIGILPAGQYKVGVLTYYYSTTLNQAVRSTYNGNFIYCDLR
jgi:hypothetical protein